MTFEQWWNSNKDIFMVTRPMNEVTLEVWMRKVWEAAQEAIPAMGFSEWAEDFSERTQEDLEGEDVDIARSAWASGFQKGRKTVGFGE